MKIYKAIDVDNENTCFGYFESKEVFLDKMSEVWYVEETGYDTWDLTNLEDKMNNRFAKVKYEVGLVEIEFNKFWKHGK